MTDDDNPSGCFIIIGLIAVSTVLIMLAFTLAYMLGPAGWLLFGGTLLVLGLLGIIGRERNE